MNEAKLREKNASIRHILVEEGIPWNKSFIVTDQILILLSAELDKLTVMNDKEIELRAIGFEIVKCPTEWKWVAKAQLDHTKKELKGLLE